MQRTLCLLSAVSLGACATAGSAWMAEPLYEHDDSEIDDSLVDVPPSASTPRPRRARPAARVIGAPTVAANETLDGNGRVEMLPQSAKLEGRVLGTFRNTYYDFPNEAEFSGQTIAIKNARCNTVKEVPRGFFEAVCVQGSGTLTNGATVSFAKRDCECAELCPRTGQRICFDELDPKQFPWGRGATGKAITPLLTVAVDSDVIPLGTPLYIPEYDGAPRDPDRRATHDGCFIAQDRGLRVKGKHVDVFTGQTAVTALWNAIIPSNKGVTVVLDSPRCARASLPGE